MNKLVKEDMNKPIYPPASWRLGSRPSLLWTQHLVKYPKKPGSFYKCVLKKEGTF